MKRTKIKYVVGEDARLNAVNYNLAFKRYIDNSEIDYIKSRD